ncbi:MAG: carboxypeptidase regulatory-like domain-containing protein [Bacteroidales bacterium]|nr:carboxypeptidase regulatory-like domain-containing protein [Bacteroidales bacterium]
MLFVVSAFAQVTTSSLNGIVTEESGEPLVGAVVTAVHMPSGSQYYAVANDKGQYHINGMRPGGPYKVEISFIGMNTEQHNNVTLTLGEPYEIDAVLTSTNELESVVVVADRSFNASLTGAGASFSRSQMENTPTINRSVYDVAKLTPQVSENKNGGISIAGTNNRYNAFSVDGADAKDSFGLASSGTNGGQTGANPISLDAIEEIQVSIAPFDVRQSGFTGGAINAITKSGTNEVKGSAYGFFFNQDLIGTTPGNAQQMKDNFNKTEREKYTNELYTTVGATVGAPIIKDKLFIFLSAEYFRQSYPNVYTPENGSYDNKDLVKPVTVDGKTYDHLTSELAQLMINHYQKTYNPQGNFSESFGQHQVNTTSINVLSRIDWNINDANKLMVRYQLMNAAKDNYGSGANTYYFNNSSYKMATRTHSVVAELNSRLSDAVHNNFRVSAVIERDNRQVPYQGANMYIQGEKPVVDLGTEYSSGANAMYSDTYTLTDNVSVFAGDHNITFGTDNKFYQFNNLFLQYAYGGYTYASIADFFANNPSQFNYRYADPELTGGEPLWSAKTRILQLGFYAQDEWRLNRNFTLTYGLRADMPIFLNKPTENPTFNATSFAKSNGEYVGVVPESRFLWSPRVGFRFYTNDEHTSLLRGGLGLFTGQAPFVWLSNAYNNTGMEAKSVTVNNPGKTAGFKFTSNPYEELIKTGVFSASGSGATINTMNKKFKYPQTFRVNLGYERSFGDGFKFTFDGLFSKTLNNVMFKNLAISSKDKVFAVNETIAKSNINSSLAPYYTIDSGDYYAIVALTNTNKGYTYSLSGKLEKSFDFGLDLMASYTFGHSYSVNDGTSSVAYSNWKYNYAVDTNSGNELSYSMFDRPHRVIAVATYTTPTYARFMNTSVTLTYEGQSGQRYCYTYSENTDFNGDGQKGNSLMYIPTVNEIGYMHWASAADAQKFENYIRSDNYLSSHRGQYSQRNAGVAPFENHFDLHISQNFIYDKKHNRKVELMFDIKNLSNMFNRAWGLYYGAAYNRSALQITDMTAVDGGYVPTYKWYGQTALTLSDFYSRWRCQLGLRLTF